MQGRAPLPLRNLLLGVLLGLAICLALWVKGRYAPAGPAPEPAHGDAPRIVALSPAVAITLKDLDLADRIVGRHAFDLALDKTIPVCGDQSGIDYEALIRVRPTHILTEWGTRDIPDKLQALAAANHWALRDYTQLTLDDVTSNALKIGLEFAPQNGIPIRGSNGEGTLYTGPQSKFVDLVQRMHEAWPAKHAPLNAGRILLLESIDPPAALGPGSFHHQILERIGGTPAITDGKPYITLDAEDILRLAPDGIIFLAPRDAAAAPSPAPTTDQLRARLGRIGTLDIPANRNGHLAVIDDPFCLTPSSALLGVTERMEQILKAWQP